MSLTYLVCQKHMYRYSAAHGCQMCNEQTQLTLDANKPSAPKGDPAQAFKSDAGKVQYNLLEDGCGVALNYIAQVMSWAVEVKGYHPHSWREVPNAITRYRAALGRHRNAIARGEVLDPESGLPHWAHAACCVIFLLELENFDV
jgi:hypothetical protein